MKKLAALSFVLLSLTAFASAQEDLRKQFGAAYAELHSGFKSGKAERLQSFFTKNAHPKFVYLGTNGVRRDLASFMRDLKVAFQPGMKLTRSDCVIKGIKRQGTTAVVDTVGDWTLLTTTNGKTQTMTGRTVMTDRWVKTSTGWKLQEAKVISEKASMDGKPLK